MKQLICFAISLIIAYDISCQPSFINQTKKNIIYFGVKDESNKISFVATGFLIDIDGAYHLVTAKHVIVNKKDGKLTDKINDDNLYVILNQFSGIQKEASLKKLREEKKVSWIFHSNAQVDIALLPFYLDVKNDDVKVLNKDIFTPMDSLFETYDVIIASLQTRISDNNNKSPIFRTGMISTKNKDKSFYIDGSVFPGNSGSPVYLKPSNIRYSQNGQVAFNLGSDHLAYQLIGIVGEYETYIDIAVSSQTGRPRVAFEENTGLTKIWSIDLLLEIATSKTCKDQIREMRNRK